MTELPLRGEKPIFIGGTGRSGTTFLARVMGSHPNIFGFRWETQFIVSPGGLADLISRPVDKSQIRMFIDNLLGRWYERTVRAGTPQEYRAGLSSDISRPHLEQAVASFITQISDLGGPVPIQSARTFILDLVSEPLQKSSASRWCEKTPRNVLYASRLAELFPDMKLLHIIRDGRDVAASIYRNGFWPIASSGDLPLLPPNPKPITPDNAVKYWVNVINAARAEAAKLPPDQYLEVRFEELIDSPHEVLEIVCEFIQEAFSPEMVSTHDFRASAVGKWRYLLTDDEVRSMYSSAGHFLADEGYAA